ncbi:hypothetical protein GWI33_017892 [Rhynchophorus ferrugineus]|uniref:Mos1 transposase HTH domain-containing protein n=1 Tax=Rhynchophorus ferrugineus TaxID=354439 RepID=A0A834M746_RHYFE|nr:hypothetical protein GWI33_017892 [Rhynchophorus ferrugineus]
MDKKKFRVLIKYCFLKGKNTVEAKTWLDAEFPDTAPGKSTTKNCSRHSKISSERVHRIIHEYLGIRKLCAKWVQHAFTFNQKQRRVDDSEQCLKMIKRNKPEFLRRYVTTWLHYFTPKSNRQSSEWTAHDEPAPKKQQSAGKLMTSVF